MPLKQHRHSTVSVSDNIISVINAADDTFVVILSCSPSVNSPHLHCPLNHIPQGTQDHKFRLEDQEVGEEVEGW